MTSSNLLRFPTGRTFARILADDHEWVVLTDTRLNPLVTVRSDSKNSISLKDHNIAFYQLRTKIPDGKHIRIYDLHTHPDQNMSVISPRDLQTAIIDQIQPSNDVEVVGHGVITKDEILIIKLKGTIEQKKQLLWADKDKGYEKYSNTISDVYHQRALSNIIFKPKQNKRTGLELNAHNSVLKEIVNEYPIIKLKKVKKTRRFTMTRRK